MARKKTSKKVGTRTPRKREIRSGHAGRKFPPALFKNAIPGSGGNAKIIAERMGCSWGAVYNRIKQMREGHKRCATPEWQEVYALLLAEEEYVADIAEETVIEVMRQRLDMATAARTARWYLERKGATRGFTPKQEVTLEGGRNPLHVKQENVLDVEALDLPLETRRQLLEAIKKKKGEE